MPHGERARSDRLRPSPRPHAGAAGGRPGACVTSPPRNGTRPPARQQRCGRRRLRRGPRPARVSTAGGWQTLPSSVPGASSSACPNSVFGPLERSLFCTSDSAHPSAESRSSRAASSASTSRGAHPEHVRLGVGAGNEDARLHRVHGRAARHAVGGAACFGGDGEDLGTGDPAIGIRFGCGARLLGCARQGGPPDRQERCGRPRIRRPGCRPRHRWRPRQRCRRRREPSRRRAAPRFRSRRRRRSGRRGGGRARRDRPPRRAGPARGRRRRGARRRRGRDPRRRGGVFHSARFRRMPRWTRDASETRPWRRAPPARGSAKNEPPSRDSPHEFQV